MASHAHHHETCLQNALQQAEDLCRSTGARFTPIRRKVLELVWGSHKAVKAYDLLEQLEQADGAQAPPTVYRALDFLLEQRLVHKVESLNAFVGCAHPKSQHGCQFLICNSCYNVSECCDATTSRGIELMAEKAGFHMQRHMLEIHGLCAHCHKQAA